MSDFQKDSILSADRAQNQGPNRLCDLPLAVPSITNSPRCSPVQTAGSGAPRRLRTTTRVDAWAVPASTNWSRPHRPHRPHGAVRKLGGGTRPTDWALPF